jgi:hypothetical protein
MKPGTLVMLNLSPTGKFVNEPPKGAVGEIVDHSGKIDWYVRDGCSVVSFPRNISVHPSGLWQYYDKRLIPLSGPDIDIGVDEEIKKPVEDLV